ncbi:unnamed protein product [Heterobilharzia americana]|nr:unnamed protein product [Heterobilharzia americana]
MVSSPNLRGIPITFSWATETAQTQTISSDPITVLMTTTSKDFTATSTLNGGITIWDLSYFNRRTLEFNLVDVINACMSADTKVASASQVEVHSGCLLVSNSYAPEFTSLPQPPKLHHLILGCRLPNSIFNELNSSLNGISCRNSTIKEYGSHKLCLLIIQLSPLNSEEVMWISDSLKAASSSSSSTAASLFSSAFDPNISSPHSVPLNLVDFLPFIGHGDLMTEEDDDYEDNLEEVDSDVLSQVPGTDTVEDLMILKTADDGDIDTTVQSPFTSQVGFEKFSENDFYTYLGLSDVVKELINMKIIEHQSKSSSKKSELNTISNASTSYNALTKDSETMHFNHNETSVPLSCSHHTKPKKVNCKGAIKLPTLVGVIHLLDVEYSKINDKCSDLSVLKISPLRLRTSFNSCNSRYPHGVLVCCGTEILLSQSETNESLSTENGDLFLFGYEACGVSWQSTEYNSILSKDPLLHIKLPNHYCPIEMEVVHNDGDLHYCSLNPVTHSVELSIDSHSKDIYSTVESNNLCICCFLLTVSGSLLQVNFYRNLLCDCQVLISDLILTDNKDNENVDMNTYNTNHLITFTYCTGLGNICLCTTNGEMYIYQLYNQELFKYDMNQQKRIILYSSKLPINLNNNNNNNDNNISLHGTIDSSVKNDSLHDLYAYYNSPIDQCFILHQLIKTIPVDIQVQITFPDQIGWYKVDLLHSLSSENNNNNNNLDDEDEIINQNYTSSSIENKTIHILSRLVTRYLQQEYNRSLHKSLSNNFSHILPITLKCATLSVQLSLNGGLSAHLWEFNIKNIKIIYNSDEKCTNTIPIELNSTTNSNITLSFEYILDIRLPQICLLSHFIFHSTMKQFDEIKTLPEVYVTLLRKNISSNNSDNFIHRTFDSVSTDNTKLNPPSVLDHDLIVHDLRAPYIDDESDHATSPDLESEYIFNFNNEWLSNHLKVPGRFHQVSTQNTISSERLRELDGNIIAGPYLLSDFLDVHKRYCYMPITSSELIKCRSRLFALHIKIVASKDKVSGASDSQSTSCENDSLLLSNIFAQIGLSVHQFKDHYEIPVIASSLSSSDGKGFDQPTDKNLRPSQLSESEIPHGRAQRLAILRSTKLHRACFEFLSCNSTCYITKSSHLLTAVYPSTIFSIILDIMNWIILIYHHELEFPCDVIENLLNMAANSCENIIENVIVHGDRECTQLGTKFMFSLLRLEFIFLKYAPPSSPYKKALLFHKLQDCLSTNHGSNDNSRLIRWLLVCQTSGGCETLLNLLDLMISISSHENNRNTEDVKSRLSLCNSLKSLMSVISLFGEESNRFKPWYHLPVCLGPVSLLNLPIFNWTYSGSECLKSTPTNLQEIKIKKSFTTIVTASNSNGSSTLPVATTAGSNVNTNMNSIHTSNIINNSFSNHLINLNGISMPSSYISFLSGSTLEKLNTSQKFDSIDNYAESSHHPLFPLCNYSPEVFMNLADIISLMRYNFITNIDPSINVKNIILPDLQDWPLYGLLDVEPLHFPLDKLSVQLNDDCEVECVDFFTGELLGSSERQVRINDPQLRTSEGSHLISALAHLTEPVEAYHLVISRMHPGAHRSVTFSSHSSTTDHHCSPVNLLTDIIIPVNPCLQCITLEALLDGPTNCQSMKTTCKPFAKLIAISTDIRHSALVLRDIHPPVEFTRLRISIVAPLDCSYTKARIHLGAYFGRAGLLMDYFNPLHIVDGDDRASNLLLCLESAIMSKTTKFITEQQTLLNIWEEKEKIPECNKTGSDKHPEMSTMSADSSMQISSLYRQCYSLQYQLNWMIRTLNRLRNRHFPELFCEYKSRICELSNEQLRQNLYPDKVKYILERCLLCLLSHSNDLLTVARPLSSSLSSPLVASMNNDTNAFIRFVDKCSSNIWNDMIIHGSRSMQILIVGLIPVLTKIHCLLPVDCSSTSCSSLYKFIKDFNAFKNPKKLLSQPQLSIIHESREQLLFWAIIQRLIHFGMTDRVLNVSVSILQDIWNSVNNENIQSISDILLLIDIIMENGCSSLLTVHKSLYGLLASLDMRRSSYCGQTGHSGLLRWHYSHQIQDINRQNMIYPYCQTRTTRVTDGTHTYDSLSQYQLCLVSFYRWNLERLAHLSTDYTANRDDHYQVIRKDSFPLGALFVRRNIDSQTSVLMKSCIPKGIQQSNTYPSKSLIPLETYQIPQQRFLCMFGDGQSIQNALSQLLPILVNLALKMLNNLLCVNKIVSSDTILFQNCFVICRLLGRICWYLPGEIIHKNFIPEGDICKSTLYQFLYSFCRRSQQSSLMNDIILECLCLILNCESVPDCPQTTKPDNYGNSGSVDLHKSKNKSWPYPNNFVVNYDLHQTTDVLWHLLPNRLLASAYSVLVNPFSHHENNLCDHIHAKKRNNGVDEKSFSGHFVLCELFSDSINTLLDNSKSLRCCYTVHINESSMIHSDPCLMNILQLYCGIVGEPSFKPWKIPLDCEITEKCQCHIKNDNLELKIKITSLKNMLELLENFVKWIHEQDIQHSDSTYVKDTTFLRSLYTLSIQFLACVSADSLDTRLFILESSNFEIFLNSILTDYSLQEGINRSCTSALEVLFTWFAYSKLNGLFSDEVTSSPLPFIQNNLHHNNIIQGPRDLQAVLFTAICSRLKLFEEIDNEASIQNNNTSFIYEIGKCITSCTRHTMSSMPIEYLFKFVKILFNYLCHHIIHLNEQLLSNMKDVNEQWINHFDGYFLCFSYYSTVVDDEYESRHKNFILWSKMASNHIHRLHNMNTEDVFEGSNPNSTYSSLFIHRLTCCYLCGECSDSTVYSKILSNSLYNDKCLGLILGNLCKIVMKYSSTSYKREVYRYFIENTTLFLSSLRLAHVPSTLGTMVTLSCLINGWKTLKRLADLIITHFKAYSVCDWLFYCVYTIMTYLDSTDPSSFADDGIITTVKTHLIQSLLSSPLLNSCSLFLLLALCLTTEMNLFSDNKYPNVIFNAFVSDTCNLSINGNRKFCPISLCSTNTSSSEYAKLSNINVCELGQAVFHQSLMHNIPCYQQKSSLLNFQYLTHSLPIGLFGPINIFTQSSSDYWQTVVNLNYPCKKDKQTAENNCHCADTLQTYQNLSKNNVLTIDDDHDIDDNRTLKSRQRNTLIDFAPIALIYSEILDEQVTSLCKTLSIIGNHNCQSIVFPMYLGSITYTSAPKIHDTHLLDNNQNKSKENSNNNTEFSNKTQEKFNLSELLKTNFTFRSNDESLQIVVRLQYLVQLECVHLSVKNSAKSASPAAVEVELYRDLPGASRRSFVSAHKSGNFPSTNSSHPNSFPSSSKAYTITFSPRLVSHILIRIYRPANLNKRLHMKTLRVLGRYADDKRFYEDVFANISENSDSFSIGNLSHSRMRPTVLLHLIHNEIISQPLPDIFYSQSFIDSLIQCLYTVSLDKQLSWHTCQLIQMVSCHQEIFEIIGRLNNMIDDSSRHTAIQNEWFHPLNSYNSSSSSSSHSSRFPHTWNSSPSSAVICERILLGLLININDDCSSLADYLISKLLKENTIHFENVSFRSESMVKQACTGVNEFNTAYWCGPMAALASTPNQRLFIWLCLHQDVGQSVRIERVINSLSHLHESIIKQASISLDFEFNYWSQLLLVFSSVLWSLGDRTNVVTEASQFWQKSVTVDLISSVYDLCTSLMQYCQNGVPMEGDSDGEIRQFTEALTGLLCSLCSIQPNAVAVLLSKLLIVPIPSTEHQYHERSFNIQLKIFNSIFSSDHIVYSVFPTNSATASDNFFYNCCIWLTDYFSSYTSSYSSTISSSVYSALRRLHILTYFMQSNQSSLLRITLGKLICDHLLPVIFSTFTSISLHNSCTRHLNSNMYEFCKLQEACITLYQTLRSAISFQKSSDPLLNENQLIENSSVYVIRSTELLIKSFKDCFSNHNFELPNFLSELILKPPLKPIAFKQTIAVFAATSNHPYTSNHLPWPVTGPPIVLNLDACELLKCDLISFLYKEIHHCISSIDLNYSIHPSLSTAFLLINITSHLSLSSKFEKILCIKHLRLLIYYILHPFSSIRNNSISHPLKLTNSIGMYTMTDFELCFINSPPNIGKIMSFKDWDNGIFLPEGYSDNWTIEHLNKQVNYSLLINQSYILCLLVRPCEHAKFLFYPSVIKQSLVSTSINKKIIEREGKNNLSLSSYQLLLEDCQSLLSIFLKSGILNSLTNSLIHLHIPNLIKSQKENAFTSKLLLIKTSKKFTNAIKQFNNYILRIIGLSTNIVDNDDDDELVKFSWNSFNKDNFTLKDKNSEIDYIIPIHCIISYILLLRLTRYDLTLLNMINSLIGDQSILSYLPNILIQLTNINMYPSLWNNDVKFKSIFINEDKIVTWMGSNTLPFQCLCHLYKDLIKDNINNSTISSNNTLIDLRWEHLNSGVLQLILGYMYVLSHGSCSNLPEIFDINEVNTYINLNQLNIDKDLLSSILQTINSLYTHFIRPGCINFEYELFPSISSQEIVFNKSINVQLNNNSMIQNGFNSISSSIPTTLGSELHKPPFYAWAKGTGFTTTTENSSINHNNISKITHSKVEREDQYAIVLCNALNGFLNAFMCNKLIDDELYGLIVSYFIMKFNLANFIINCLRNDSIVEIVNRISLYQSIFRLIHSITLCPTLHWLLTFIQGDLEANLTQRIISKSFNGFLDYWENKNDNVDDSLLKDNIYRKNDIAVDDDDDDLNTWLNNVDSSCIAVLLRQILSYLSTYQKQLNKLGLIGSTELNYQSREKSTEKASETTINTQSDHPSKGLTRQLSIRYRSGYKHIEKDLINTTNLLFTSNVSKYKDDKSSKLYSLGKNSNYCRTSKIYGILQLGCGFYDQYDKVDEEDKNTLYTLTESDADNNEDIREDNEEDDNDVVNESVEELSENTDNKSQLTNSINNSYIDEETELVNQSNEISDHDSLLPLNNGDNDDDISNDHLSIHQFEKILTTLINKLRITLKIIKVILIYQKSSIIHQELNYHHHLDNSGGQSPNEHYINALFDLHSNEGDVSLLNNRIYTVSFNIQ